MHAENVMHDQMPRILVIARQRMDMRDADQMLCHEPSLSVQAALPWVMRMLSHISQVHLTDAAK